MGMIGKEDHKAVETYYPTKFGRGIVWLLEVKQEIIINGTYIPIL